MTQSDPAEPKKECSYWRSPGRRCLFEPEDGHDLCIFHLSVEQKRPEKFWQHLASYLRACYDAAGTKKTDVFRDASSRWIHREGDGTLVAKYTQDVKKRADEPWYFCGFVFPAMDHSEDGHNFRQFVFPAVDFTYATFEGDADFFNLTFHGEARFISATFADKKATTYFSRAKFLAGADFFGATFNAVADFSFAEFNGRGAQADFRAATFRGKADFSRAEFGVDALFLEAKFDCKADFSGRMSEEKTTVFKGNADFSRAAFGADLSFERACFLGEVTRFRDCDFSGPVYLRRTLVKGLLVLDYVNLRNQLLFDGTILDRECKVLLWGLNFVHGTSDVVMEKGHEKGRIIGPAGQVVFRDIQDNMNRVSFLHTDILTDRLCIRFSNVKWERDPREFIFDARFVFSRHQEWQKRTGLPDWAIKQLPELLFADRPMPGETPEQHGKRCERLVEQDVKRIAREIRRSTEQYGSYWDAGNIHIAEMDYRRERTPCPSFHRFLLAAYNELSVYGESPGRAGRYLLWLVIAAAGGYMHAGIAPLLACLYGIGGLVPGLVRAAGAASSKSLFVAVMVLQSGLGAVLVSLLLLAIRRRFGR